MGEIGLFCVYWDYAEWKIFSELGNFFLSFKSQMCPLYLLIIVFPKFDPWTATGMALYCKMSQNFKSYLAYSEYKQNQVKLIPRLSGIDFSLYWV